MQDKKKPSKQREVPYTDEGSYKAAKKAYQDSTSLYNQGEAVKRYVKADKNNFDVKETPISNKNKKLILDTNKKEHSKALDIDYSKGSMYEKTPLPYTGNSYRANSEINKNNLYQEMISEHKSDAIAPTKSLNYKRKGAFDFIGGPQEVKSDIIYDKPKTKPVKKYSSGTKKCNTGVKKMKLDTYQGGSKKVDTYQGGGKVVVKKTIKPEPRDVSMLKQNVDLHRAVKNKNASDGSPMYKDDVREIAQKRITNDSTQLAKKGYPKYVEGTSGIFSKKRRDDAELEANIIDAGDAIAKQVETPKSTISSVAVTPKKMNLFGRLKRNQEEGNAYAASIDAEDEAPKTPTKTTTESSFVGPEQPEFDRTVAKNLAPKSDTDELDAAAKSTPQTKTNVVKGADPKLAAWQKRHGLKADGIWGAKSAAKYAELQKAKSPKKTTITSTEISRKPMSFSSPKTIEESTKNYPTVKGKSYAKEKTNPSDSARRAEYLYPDPEMHGSRVNTPEQAQRLVDIDKKGEEATFSTAAKVGVPVAVAGALAYGAYKNKGKMKGAVNTAKAFGSKLGATNKSVNVPDADKFKGKTTIVKKPDIYTAKKTDSGLELIDNPDNNKRPLNKIPRAIRSINSSVIDKKDIISGGGTASPKKMNLKPRTEAPSTTTSFTTPKKNTVKAPENTYSVSGNTKSTTPTSTISDAQRQKEIYQRGRVAAAKVRENAARNKNTMKPTGEYMTDEQRAAIKAGVPLAEVKKGVTAPKVEVKADSKETPKMNLTPTERKKGGRPKGATNKSSSKDKSSSKKTTPVFDDEPPF